MKAQNDMPDGRMMVFSGNAHLSLATAIASHLHIALGKVAIGRFSDGEIQVEIQENVRGKDVFIIQPTCNPTNENLMELLVMLDAMRRASADRITAVLPYYGYARQDRRPRSARVPITAKLVAAMLGTAGANRVLTVDLHSDQIQGYFDVPLDNVYASPVLLGDVYRRKDPAMVVVSPDVGGVVRARATAKRMEGVDLAIIDKRRPRPNEAKVMHIIGTVAERTCVLIDDLVDTAGTLCEAASALKARGALKVVAYCTHPVLSGSAVENIQASQLDELIVTDTIPLGAAAQACSRIRVLSISEMLAETMRRISMDESVSSLFVD